jgi:hypothetical protein
MNETDERRELAGGADHIAQPVGARKQNLFDGGAGGLNFCLGHGGVPSRESGDVEHHQPAMTALLSEFAEVSAHYPESGMEPDRLLRADRVSNCGRRVMRRSAPSCLSRRL